MQYEGLIHKLSGKLKAISHKLDGKYSHFSDEDLYQEALLYLWLKQKDAPFTDETDSYIVQGCFFHLKNHIRMVHKGVDRRTICFSKPIDRGDTMGDCLAKEEANTGGEIEMNMLVEECMSLLSDREKKVFTLALEERTVREIGKKLGVSHVTIVKTMKSIREKCRPLFGE